MFSNLINIIISHGERVNFEGWLQTYMEKSISQQYRSPKCQTGYKVFDRTTIAALDVLGPRTSKLQHWEGTAQFIGIVLKFWNIVNVKIQLKDFINY